MVGMGGEDPDHEGSCSHLGSCPACGTAIPRAQLVINYVSPDGWPKLFAECPRCGDVVSPL